MASHCRSNVLVPNGSTPKEVLSAGDSAPEAVQVRLHLATFDNHDVQDLVLVILLLHVVVV